MSISGRPLGWHTRDCYQTFPSGPAIQQKLRKYWVFNRRLSCLNEGSSWVTGTLGTKINYKSRFKNTDTLMHTKHILAGESRPLVYIKQCQTWVFRLCLETQLGGHHSVSQQLGDKNHTQGRGGRNRQGKVSPGRQSLFSPGTENSVGTERNFKSWKPFPSERRWRACTS